MNFPGIQCKLNFCSDLYLTDAITHWLCLKHQTREQNLLLGNSALRGATNTVKQMVLSFQAVGLEVRETHWHVHPSPHSFPGGHLKLKINDKRSIKGTPCNWDFVFCTLEKSFHLLTCLVRLRNTVKWNCQIGNQLLGNRTKRKFWRKLRWCKYFVDINVVAVCLDSM